jgi:hypothetical protein
MASERDAVYIHYMARLVRKQVYLTAEQDEWLTRTAAQERRPAAEVLRAALDARMRPQRAPKTRLAKDSLWKIVGLGTSERPDVSEQVDHYLYGVRRR